MADDLRLHLGCRGFRALPRTPWDWPELAAVPAVGHPSDVFRPGVLRYARAHTMSAAWRCLEAIAAAGGPAVVQTYGGHRDAYVFPRWVLSEIRGDRDTWDWSRADAARWRVHWRRLHAVDPALRAAWMDTSLAVGEGPLCELREAAGVPVFQWPWFRPPHDAKLYALRLPKLYTFGGQWGVQP